MGVKGIGKRAICPECHLELVQVLLVIGDVIVHSWLCDCGRVDEFIRDTIVETRNMSDEAVAVITFNEDYLDGGDIM